MAGGYISCNNFRGEDKSGSALSGVIDGLADFVPSEDRDDFKLSVLNPINEAMDEAVDHILIDPSIAAKIRQPIEDMYNNLGSELGYPEPWNALEYDEEQGLDPSDAKWGAGKGWQYYCLHDLRLACDESIRSGKPICISFD